MATTESKVNLSDILGVELPGVRISSQTVTITPDKAGKLLNEAIQKYQRESQQATVDRYADTMKQGYWHVSTIRLATVKGQKGFYVINGKHRLSAVQKADLAQDFQVEVVLCDTPEEVRELVAIEDRGKTRTAVDAAQITGLADELNLGRDYGKLAAAVGQIIHGWTTTGGGVRQQMAHEVWERSAKDWVPFYIQYKESTKLPEAGEALETVAKAIQRRLQTPAMIGLGMVILRSQPDRAKEFLTKIASAHTPGNPKDPVRQLVNLMAGTTYPSNPAVAARTVATAWNAFVQGHQLTTNLRPVERIEGLAANKVPIWLIGTPYVGVDHSYYTPTPGFPVFYREGLETSPQSTWNEEVGKDQPRWKVVFGKEDAKKAKQDARNAARDARVEKTSLRAQLKELAAAGEHLPKSMVDRATELGLTVPKARRKKAVKAEQPTLPESEETPKGKRGRKAGTKIDKKAIEATAFKKPASKK